MPSQRTATTPRAPARIATLATPAVGAALPVVLALIEAPLEAVGVLTVPTKVFVSLADVVPLTIVFPLLVKLLLKLSLLLSLPLLV